MRIKVIGLIVLLVLIPNIQYVGASAFSIYEAGVRAMGMGGAFAAVADDGSALFYNPAGIAFQRGFRMQLALFAIHRRLLLPDSTFLKRDLMEPSALSSFRY